MFGVLSGKEFFVTLIQNRSRDMKLHKRKVLTMLPLTPERSAELEKGKEGPIEDYGDDSTYSETL
eukprot:3469198-Amphidinium_carterae.1